LEQFRHQGLSSALLKMGFPIIKQNLCNLVWCNARENAIGYYKKVGFEEVGDNFDIPDVGVHKLMVRNLYEDLS